MNALQLYKFIEDNDIEYHYQQDDVIAFINARDLSTWFELVKNSSFLDDEGYPCVMKDGYLAIWMRDICESLDIELSEIFDKTKEK